MVYEKTKFWALLKHFEIKEIIKSRDLILAVIVAILVSFFSFFCCSGSELKNIISDISPIFIGISGTMITIAIAGLAIIVALADEKFIQILKKAGIFEDLLFLFLFSTIISAISIIINVIAKISTVINIPNFNFYYIVIFLSIFFVLYSLFSVILLVGTTMRFGIYRGKFLEKNKYKNKK